MIHNVLSQFGIDDSASIKPLGNAGGFSGASITRIESPAGDHCLRKWPKSHPTQERLDWIHRVLLHAKIIGCPVPPPIRTTAGDTFLRFREHFWELTPWLPGLANFEQDPNSERLKDTVHTLAKLHQSNAQIQLEFGQSNNMLARIEQLRAFPQRLGMLDRHPALQHSEMMGSLHAQLRRCSDQVQPCIENLEQFGRQPWVIQPVIRDLWHDHILFTENQVTGIVDFGAMQMDNVALDLARMLGSLLGDPDDPKWITAIDQYHLIRPLSTAERQAIPILDRSAVLLGALNWLCWIVLEQKSFEDWKAVERRVRILGDRLEYFSAE